MRTILMGVVLLALAGPAAAIDKGDCCADVNGVCISTCNKSSCTGNGDCDLALTSAPTGVDASTPAVRRSLKTMDRGDRATLRRIFAAASDTADIGQGECCAKVHGVCISSCQQASCTGNGDCKLVESAKPSSSPSSPQVKKAMKTLSPRDQAVLERNLTASLGGTGAGGRPDYEPVQGVKAPGGGASTEPSFKQLGSTQAKVPMKHGSCGLDCGIHVLATKSGNLNVSAQVEMSCPAGSQVSYVAYRLEGQNVTKLVQSPTASSSFSQKVQVQPFSTDELEEACQQALGGGWAEPGHHNNKSATAKKTIKENVKVWGGCSNWANNVSRVFPVALTLTCEDQSWSVPVP